MLLLSSEETTTERSKDQGVSQLKDQGVSQLKDQGVSQLKDQGVSQLDFNELIFIYGQDNRLHEKKKVTEGLNFND